MVARDVYSEWKIYQLGGDGDSVLDSEVDLERILAGDDAEKLPPPTLFRFLEGPSMFYDGVINTVFGYGGHGKSMLTSVAVAQAIMDGHHASYFTYELPPKVLVARMLSLGASREAIVERFHVFQSHVGPPKRLIEKWGGVDGPHLVVVDSTNKALVAHELDSDKVNGFGKLNNLLLRPMTDAGMTVVTIDHVTQNAENRNRMIGSAEKWNAVQGAAYKIERGREFSTVQSGWSSIQLMKDNQSATGWTSEQIVGYLVVEANGLGEGRSKIWTQCGRPVNSDRVSDIARLAEQNSNREDVEKEAAETRASAIIMEVMETPYEYNQSTLAKRLMDTYGDRLGKDRTWRSSIKSLLNEGTLTADSSGRLARAIVDAPYDASSEIA
jgi:hypothetical protein